MTKLKFIFITVLFPILMNGQNDLSFPNGGDLCEVKQILTKNSEAIREEFNVDDSVSSFTFTLPNEYWLNQIAFPLENKTLLKSFFGTIDLKEVNDSVFEISELLKKYNDTLDFSERRSGLNASCTEGDFCLSVKYSPIYNNVFMVNIYERIENDGGSNDLSENKVQYLFSFGRYGDIQGWTLIKATSNKK